MPYVFVKLAWVARNRLNDLHIRKVWMINSWQPPMDYLNDPFIKNLFVWNDGFQAIKWFINGSQNNMGWYNRV